MLELQTRKDSRGVSHALATCSKRANQSISHDRWSLLIPTDARSWQARTHHQHVSAVPRVICQVSTAELPLLASMAARMPFLGRKSKPWSSSSSLGGRAPANRRRRKRTAKRQQNSPLLHGSTRHPFRPRLLRQLQQTRPSIPQHAQPHTAILLHCPLLLIHHHSSLLAPILLV